MRVVLNGLAALKPKTGVGHHVADLHAALVATQPADRFSLYPGRLLGQTFRYLCQPKKDQAAHPDHDSSRPQLRGMAATATDRSGWARGAAKSAAKWASRLHFAGFSRAFRFDLYHEPNFVPFASPLPTVITVHDLSVLKYPHWHPLDRVRVHQKHFQRGLGRAEHVIVVSEAVRRELIDELNCPPDRVTAVYNGVGPQYTPQPDDAIRRIRREFDLPEKFFLCVGTIEPRKNIGTALRAFADLPAGVQQTCPLVLAGPWGWRSEAEHQLYDTVGRAAGVRHLGYVPADRLPALYAAARVLLYPSHYEGFGLPPVEMLACGGAVIASTAEAVREVVGRHAWFVDPDDTAGWRAVMTQAATDDEFVFGLRTGGQAHAARYTWERAAAETVAVYRTVLGKTGARSVPAAPRRLAA